MNEKAAFLKAFGEHVRQIREAKQLSLQDVADNCELIRETVHKIETGQRNFGIYTVVQLAKGLQVSIKDLFNFKYNV